ncbi:hypothetical protein ONE63_002950 [Megalurothrips usitatus]|uniref:NADP-dependent oxidoreductase domain-containing protein n=1 Tax=Megalurothrips usitatus TaxID=439358 RepID=A0AAV7X9H1_9NEOP|nr:hypothetical protein ONE63_002950 [Megalurothrips usitatus]
MATLAPTTRLSNGVHIPVIGLGTWQAAPGEVQRAVAHAIDVGYRHIDCAAYYRNEAEVGAAIRRKVDDGVVRREELFVTSKLWGTDHRPDRVLAACATSLRNFGLDYLDLYLVHSPMALKVGQEGSDVEVEGATAFDDVDFLETWRSVELCAERGLARSVGVSNFNSRQLDRVLEDGAVPPVVNQVECHAHLNQKRLTAFCADRGVLVTAYSPLASPARPWAAPADPLPLRDPRVAAVAARHGRTPAQVLLRYLIQLGTVPIPKSVSASRIRENFRIFDFQLSAADVAALDGLDCDGRLFVFPE